MNIYKSNSKYIISINCVYLFLQLLELLTYFYQVIGSFLCLFNSFIVSLKCNIVNRTPLIDILFYVCYNKYMIIQRLKNDFVICKVRNISDIVLSDNFCFIAKTDEEISVVCSTENLPQNATHISYGWKAFR